MVGFEWVEPSQAVRDSSDCLDVLQAWSFSCLFLPFLVRPFHCGEEKIVHIVHLCSVCAVHCWTTSEILVPLQIEYCLMFSFSTAVSANISSRNITHSISGKLSNSPSQRHDDMISTSGDVLSWHCHRTIERVLLY